jgi:hypothetical protein
MAAYLPQDWPEAVRPPGSEDFEASAVAFPVKFICLIDPRIVARTAHGRPGPGARVVASRVRSV